SGGLRRGVRRRLATGARVPRPARLDRGLRRAAVGVAIAVDDPPARQVVRRELQLDPVADQDLDPVAAHLSGGVARRFGAVVERDAIHAAFVRLDDFAVDLDLLLLLGDAAPSFAGDARG